MEESRKIFTIANVITFLRILLVPIFVATFYFCDGDESYTTALVVFLVACLTDLLDGMVARIKGQGSRIGTVLDPFADKLMQVAALIAFTTVGIIPLWFTITIGVVYGLMVVIGLALFAQKKEIESNVFGKIGASIMAVGLAMCFFESTFNPWNMCVLYAGLAVVVVSVFVYFLSDKEKFIGTKSQKKKSGIDN